MTDFHYKDFKFDRSELKPGWVHLGWGNFARSFIGDITNHIANKGHKDFGLVVIAPTERQQPEMSTLASQDNIYHLIQCNGSEMCRRIGAVCESMIGAQDGLRVISTLARPVTQVVSLTVTADGYCVDKDKCSGFDLGKMNGDLEALKKQDWTNVKTTPGWIVAGLYQRFAAGQKPFVVMSCDNLEMNGSVTSRLLQEISSQMGNTGFADYVREQVLCPNTVVDRITPKQQYESQSQYIKQKGIIDHCPVVSEGHREFCIQDEQKRLPANLVDALKSAKTEFVDDITPYQDRKIRILNGGHMLIGVAGTIFQVDTVRKGMQHKALRILIDHFHHQVMDAIAPTQPKDVGAYRDEVVARFENPNPHGPDTISRLLSKTASKVDARFVNTPALEQGTGTSASALAVAAWLQYLRGRDASGNGYNVHTDDAPAAKTFSQSAARPEFRASLTEFLTKPYSKVGDQVMQGYVSQVIDNLRLITSHGLENAIHRQFPLPARPAAVYQLRSPRTLHQ